MVSSVGDPVCILILVYSSYFLASQSLAVYMLLPGAVVMPLVQLLAQAINW